MSQQLVASPCGFDAVRHDRRERWQRASSEDAEIERHDDHTWTIEFEDGEDDHDIQLWTTGDIWVGVCDCDGFAYHDHACAHLCRVRQELAVGDLESTVAAPPEDLHIQTDDGALEGDAGELTNDDVQEDSADEDDPVASDDVQEPEVVDEPERENGRDGDLRRADHAGPPTPIPGGSLEDPLETLPEWMKTAVDRHGGDVDLNKRGCQVIANYLGFDVDVEPIKRAHDTDFEYAVYEATASAPTASSWLAPKLRLTSRRATSRSGTYIGWLKPGRKSAP